MRQFLLLAFLFWRLTALVVVTAEPNPIQFVTSTTDPNEINGATLAFYSHLNEQTAPSDPVVFRVDQLTDALVNHALANITDDEQKVEFVMNGLTVTDAWVEVLQDERDLEQTTDGLSLFVGSLLGLLPLPMYLTAQTDAYPNFLESREMALELQGPPDNRNFTQEVMDAYEDVLLTNVTLPFAAAPLYQLTYGYENSTNAKYFGYIDDRCFLLFNIGAKRMLQPLYFQSALIHETWHCFQPPLDTTNPIDLWHVVLREGVVMYLTHLTNPSIKEADLLLWSPEQLEAAESYEDEIRQVFEEVRLSTDSNDFVPWYYTNIPLSTVPGTHTRAGYYMAWLAVEAYASEQDFESDQELIEHLLEVSETTEGREAMWEAYLMRTQEDDLVTITPSVVASTTEEDVATGGDIVTDAPTEAPNAAPTIPIPVVNKKNEMESSTKATSAMEASSCASVGFLVAFLLTSTVAHFLQ